MTRQCNISWKYYLSMTPILETKLFYVWGIDFMGLFLSFEGMKYILVGVYYMSKWEKEIFLPNYDGRSIASLVEENIFSLFCTMSYHK